MRYWLEIENKRRLQTLSIDNAWSNIFFVLLDVFYATTYIFRSVTNIKNTKIKRGTGDNIKKQ